MTDQTTPQTFQVFKTMSCRVCFNHGKHNPIGHLPGADCPTIKEFKCGYCKETGHTIKCCSVLAEKKTKKEDESWKLMSLGDYNARQRANHVEKDTTPNPPHLFIKEEQNTIHHHHHRHNVPEVSNMLQFPSLGQNSTSTSTSNVQTSWGSNKQEQEQDQDQDQIVPKGQEPNVNKLQLSCSGIDRWYIGGVLASNEEVMEYLWPGESNCSWADDDGGMNQ